MAVFEYGQVEVEYLKQQDEILGAAMERIGLIQREVTPHVFTALVHSVLSQQISAKAAQTVYGRMATLLCHEITPQQIVAAGLEAIKGCGMSTRKASYIIGIAEAALTGIIDFNTLDTFNNEEIIKKLTILSGVGTWTAEMLLIFSLCRSDVVSYGDLAIRRGMMNLYSLAELSKETFEQYRQRYSPYGTVASFYLWALSVE